MIGQAPAFLQMLRCLERIAGFDASVLIQGETGTGKELAARRIHYQSTRRGQPFVPVNCGTVPEQLFENELFGHRKGAFTDAHHDQDGLVNLCGSGTLFFDEIDALPPKGQVALLRFIQDQHFRPLGSGKEQQANVRIVAATNTDLDSLCQQGRFRYDLLYRLKVLYLEVPPLRARRGDASLLAAHFLRGFAERFGKPEQTLHPETAAWFDGYSWPGNVRELENLVCREFLMSEENLPQLQITPLRQTERRKTPDRRVTHLLTADFSEAKAEAMRHFESRYLLGLLRETRGNVTAAAKLAQKERRFIGKLIKKHQLDKSQFVLSGTDENAAGGGDASLDDSPDHRRR